MAPSGPRAARMVRRHSLSALNDVSKGEGYEGLVPSAPKSPKIPSGKTNQETSNGQSLVARAGLRSFECSELNETGNTLQRTPTSRTRQGSVPVSYQCGFCQHWRVGKFTVGPTGNKYCGSECLVQSSIPDEDSDQPKNSKAFRKDLASMLWAWLSTTEWCKDLFTKNKTSMGPVVADRSSGTIEKIERIEPIIEAYGNPIHINAKGVNKIPSIAPSTSSATVARTSNGSSNSTSRRMSVQLLGMPTSAMNSVGHAGGQAEMSTSPTGGFSPQSPYRGNLSPSPPPAASLKPFNILNLQRVNSGRRHSLSTLSPVAKTPIEENDIVGGNDASPLRRGRSLGGKFILNELEKEARSPSSERRHMKREVPAGLRSPVADDSNTVAK